MAPANCDITHPSQFVIGTGSSGWLVLQPRWTSTTATYAPVPPQEKKETKKEQRDRISKEKMYASWQIFNQQTVTVKEVVQICKPQHRLSYMARRF